MSEEWRQIPGWEDRYEVSDHDSVRSLDRTIYAHFGPLGEYTGRVWKGKPLKPTFDHQGYPYVTLCRGLNDRIRLAVHSLVLRAFVGPLPDGMETRHLNGNNSDPRLVNLKYGTRLENAHDNIVHRKHHCLKKTHCKQGHLLAGDNLYVVESKGWRQCRTCRNEASRRYRGKSIGASMIASVMSILAISTGSATAHADPGVEPQVARYALTAAPSMCLVLDEYPTLPGVEGVLQGIHNDSGFTAYQSGEALALGVQAGCPRHVPLLERFARTFIGGDTTTTTGAVV